jgi:transporter family protein
MAASTTVAVKLWIVPAIACATAYALYNLFLKQAAMAGMDPVFGGVFMQVGASIATLALLARRYAFQSSAVAATAYPMSRTAILWAIAAGVSVGGAELLSFVVSGLGVPATQSIPVLIGGSVLVGTVLGRLWLGELLNWQGWLGVALISLGIALVGMASPGGMH